MTAALPGVLARWRRPREVRPHEVRPHEEADYLPPGYVETGWQDYMDRRAATLLGDVDPATARGLEIGPLDHPVVRRANEGRGEARPDVLYVDYAEAEVLRARFAGSDRDADAIEVDVVWDERPLRDCLPPGPPVDYALAVHVVEHVPDLVGWLADLRGALREGGMLGLIVPDRRHTFDLRRRESTLGEVLDAYWQRARRPTMRQVFDHYAYAAEIDVGASWRVPPEALLPRAVAPETLAHARDLAESLLAGPAYHDSHCWAFTPASFVALAAELAALRLFPFAIEFIQPTMLDWHEFFVRLRAAGDPDDPGRADAPEIAASLERARERVAADVHEHIYAERMRRATAPNMR